MALTVKVCLDGREEELCFMETPSFKDLERAMKSLGGFGVAKYVDEEGDLCTLLENTYDDFLITAKEQINNTSVLKLKMGSYASGALPEVEMTEDVSDGDISDGWECVDIEDVNNCADTGLDEDNSTKDSSDGQEHGRTSWFSRIFHKEPKIPDTPEMPETTEPVESPELEEQVTQHVSTEGSLDGSESTHQEEEKEKYKPSSCACKMCECSLQLHLPSPFRHWQCDLCHRRGFTEADPMWACSTAKACDWGICMDCNESFSVPEASTSKASEVEACPPASEVEDCKEPCALPAALIGAAGLMLGLPVLCAASKMITGRQKAKSERQR